jgi:hypothetical protein
MSQRPISVTVFGILNIGFALLNFVGLLFSALITRVKLPGTSGLAAMKSDPVFAAWTQFSNVAAVLFGIILIASGIGLLLLQNWARILSLIYSALDVIVVIVGAVIGRRVTMQVMTSQAPGAPAGLMAMMAEVGFAMGIIIGLTYPILLLIFMTRPKVVEAFRPPTATLTPPQSN